MEKENLIPCFGNIKFNSEEEFAFWLDRFTKYEILLVDRGQDLQVLHLYQSGEILHCNLQQSIWNGRFVNLEHLEKDRPIEMLDQEKKEWVVYHNLIVEEIITIEK